MNETVDTQKVGRKIPGKQLLTSGIMYGSNNITNVARGLYLSVYLLIHFKIQNELFILANLLFLVYNVLNNVVFSIYADKPRYKLGRRIPYIRYGSLLLLVSNILIWFPWPGTHFGDMNTGAIMKFVQYLVYLFVWDTVWTVVSISFAAWIPEATESEEERAKLSVILRVTTAIGGLSIIVIPLIWNSGLDAFRMFMVIGNTAMALCYFVGSFILKERPELYKYSYKDKSVKDVLKQFLGLYKSKTFLSYAIFVFSTTLMMQFNNIFPVYIGYSLGWEYFGEYIVTFIFYSCSYGMLPVLYFIMKSKPIDRIILNIIKYGLIFLFVFFILMLITGFSWFLYPILALGGAMLMVGLYGSIIGGNVIDNDELETGERREALYIGASSLVLIPMEQIVSIITAVILIVVNYNVNVAGFEQEPSVYAGIRFLTFSVIFIGGAFTLLSIKLYPFKGELLVKLKEDIMKLHERKEVEHESSQESHPKS